MGKLTGIIKLVGQLDGLSFYKLKDKIVVRKTGGFDGEKIKKEAKYVRVRENSSEFAESARAGKYFRSSLAPYLKLLRLSDVQSRVVSFFLTLSRLDTESQRGARKVAKGLLHADAAGVVSRFEFDAEQSFGSIFPFGSTVDFAAGTLTITDFQLKGIKKPKAATRVELRFLLCGLDFALQDSFHLSESDWVAYDFGTTTAPEIIVLSSAVPAAPTVFGVLFVRFSQRVNAQEYVLQNAVMKVVGLRTIAL